MSMLETANKLVLEHGVYLEREEGAQWRMPYSGSLASQEIQLATLFKSVRPVLVSFTERPRSGPSWWLMSPSGSVLDLVIQEKVGQFKEGDSFARFSTDLDMQFVLGNLIYHCKRIATEYVSAICDFVDLPHVEKTEKRSMFQGRHEVYFELEAVLSAAMRAMEFSRFVVHLHSEVDSGPESARTPTRNFGELIKLAADFPPRIKESILRAAELYEEVRQYRNCLVHNATMDFGMGSIMMERNEQYGWGLSAPMPKNPSEGNRAKFTYTYDKDALGYGWSITNRVVERVLDLVAATRDSKD